MAGATKQLATADFERQLLGEYELVAGIDEVGRGAWAGPLCVGVALVRRECGEPPAGLADSKKLSAKQRQEMVAPLQQWLADYALGWATNREIDDYGISRCLRLAACRAFADLDARGWRVPVAILDGPYDYLDQAPDLFSDPAAFPPWPGKMPRVIAQSKADALHAVVAGASVLAKVARDDFMAKLEDPGYDWASNKGYNSPRHSQAIGQLGLSPLHRQSWKIPGQNERIRG